MSWIQNVLEATGNGFSIQREVQSRVISSLHHILPLLVQEHPQLLVQEHGKFSALPTFFRGWLCYWTPYFVLGHAANLTPVFCVLTQLRYTPSLHHWDVQPAYLVVPEWHQWWCPAALTRHWWSLPTQGDQPTAVDYFFTVPPQGYLTGSMNWIRPAASQIPPSANPEASLVCVGQCFQVAQAQLSLNKAILWATSFTPAAPVQPTQRQPHLPAAPAVDASLISLQVVTLRTNTPISVGFLHHCIWGDLKGLFSPACPSLPSAASPSNDVPPASSPTRSPLLERGCTQPSWNLELESLLLALIFYFMQHINS